MPYDNSMAGLGGALVAVSIIWSLVGLLYLAWFLWAMARLFPYLGLPAAHGWIPVWNQWRLVDRGGYPGWLVLLMFVPGANIVAAVIMIMAIHRINKEAGEGAGMTVVGALIPPLWATLLGSRLRDSGRVLAAGAPIGAGYAAQTGNWQGGQQQAVEYGPDGRAYPTLGEGYPAQNSYAPQGFADQGFADQNYAAQGQGDQSHGAPQQNPAAQDAGWAMPSLPQEAFDPSGAYAPAAPAAPAVPAAPAGTGWAPPAAPAQPTPPANPWSLGSTVDGNFERLANEELPPRDANFGGIGGPNGGVDARPFSWPEPQPVGGYAPPMPEVPAAPPVVPAAPSAPAVPEAPASPAVPAATPDTSFAGLFAPPVPPAPEAPAPAPAPAEAAVSAMPVAPAPPTPPAPPAVSLEDEIGATVVTGGAAAPISNDDDLDHTVVVSRAANWSLVLADGTILDLDGDDIVLGRRPSSIDGSATLLIPDSTRTLSKSHARLRRVGETWTIEDLNSTNGVFVFDASGAQIELVPGTPQQASEQLIIGTLEVQLRATY